jgi:hypothetical protein
MFNLEPSQIVREVVLDDTLLLTTTFAPVLQWNLFIGIGVVPKLKNCFRYLLGAGGGSVGGYTPLEFAYKKLMLIPERENFCAFFALT